MLYFLYRAGQRLALALPLPWAYAIACGLSDLKYLFSIKDRRAVLHNLSAVTGPSDPELPRMSKEVFRNFSKYLVDFFRLEKLDRDFIRRRVTVIGRGHVDGAFKRGKGAILLTAHLGNYELGAAIAAVGGYPVNAIVLNHQSSKIDALFVARRKSKGVSSIPLRSAVRQGFACLKRNEPLGIVGDRDFTGHGLRLPFLGRQMSVPKGPAFFSLRTGAPVIPTFLIRAAGGKFQMIFEKPIEPIATGDEERDIESMTRTILSVLEQYVRRYPTQWYLFRDFTDPTPAVVL
ncbi:MAG: lysophospholipid acyltransferase family protein [Candidatus Omnitrophica bacterium]|nr:lysophospholipid acyltransferase family protein [Candidatus Omnitrophota bacterium]